MNDATTAVARFLRANGHPERDVDLYVRQTMFETVGRHPSGRPEPESLLCDAIDTFLAAVDWKRLTT